MSNTKKCQVESLYPICTAAIIGPIFLSYSYLMLTPPLPYQQDALPGHPSYGQHRPALDAVVVAAVQVSAHPKVSNLDGEAAVQQAVPGGQVPVHEVQRRQVLHP